MINALLCVRRGLRKESYSEKFNHVVIFSMRNALKYGFLKTRINFARLAEVIL
jgi:hypothetical protein